MDKNSKLSKLIEILKPMKRVIVAYSGGVDSTFLLKAASMAGLERLLAVTASSESLPEEELSSAIEIASMLNVEHRVIVTEELKDERYTSNPPERCYFCKKELFSKLRDIAQGEGFNYIIDGTNAEDADDWRPGIRAAMEMGVRSPLSEAGLVKQEIRELSLGLGLPTWDKPSTPCLSSRFPYGHRITAEGLRRVKEAERFLRGLGLRELRVRDHGDIARIEVLPENIPRFMDDSVRTETVAFFRGMGYKYITLDLQGFRSGSLNEGIIQR